MRGITSLGLAPCLLLTVIAAAALVAGLENDDLVFDHDSKLSAADTLAEQESSLLHSLWNWLNLKTDFFSSSPVKSSGQLDKSVESNSLFNTDPRRKREVKEDNKVISDDPSYPYKSRNYKDDTSIRPKLSEKYQQGDDEDDAGSGEPDGEREVEGSAISYDYFATQPTTISHSNPVTQSNFIDQSNEFAEKNVYRISMTIKEPYREEFERRDGEKFKKFAENLTKAVEDLLHQHLRKEDHVTFVKMENAPDPFESHVHLDVHTMSKEAEVRDVLERHVNIYHSLGKFTVIPASLVLRAVLECQPGEIACDVSRCILQTQRCDFKSDCADGSDEAGCKYPENTKANKVDPRSPGNRFG